MKRIMTTLTAVVIVGILLLGCECKEKGEDCNSDDDCCSDSCVFLSPLDSLGTCE